MSATSYNTLFVHRLTEAGKKKFIESQMLLARKIVNKHFGNYTGPQARTQQLLDELLSAAYFALVQSAKYFNIARQFEPTTYAHKSMENAVRSHLREIQNGGLVRCKRKRNIDSPKDPKVIQFDELCESILSKHDEYTDDSAVDPSELIKSALESLTQEERKVIIAKYYHGESFSTLAKKDRSRRTRQRFKQIEKSAIKKMREKMAV